MNEVHTQTHRSASSLLHMPELLNMHLTPGFKEYSVEFKKKKLPETAAKHLSPVCIVGLFIHPCLSTVHTRTHMHEVQASICTAPRISSSHKHFHASAQICFIMVELW